MKKLTPKQAEVLDDIVTGRATHFVSHYPPIKKLLELGYVDLRPVRFSDTYVATPAGLAEHARLNVVFDPPIFSSGFAYEVIA